MEKSKMLNISDSVSLLKENYNNYKEVKHRDDFASYNKKNNLYNNWIVTLCNTYNSLLKYYTNNTNEYWDKINLFTSQVYEYENMTITLHELIKKYRNKNVHSENPNSVGNNLLPILVSDTKLEKLQTMLMEVINYELKQIDKRKIVNHVIKNGKNIINYKKIMNSIDESMKNATPQDKKMLEPLYSTMKHAFSVFTDESVVNEEVLGKLEKELIVAKNMINSKQFRRLMLKQPQGQSALEFLEQINQINSVFDSDDLKTKF